MLFSIKEIIDIVIICLALGFIFQGMFKSPKKTINYDPLEEYKAKPKRKWIDWHDFKFAIAVVAPAIILHEFGHKFMAMGFGTTATFHAAYKFLLLGIGLKIISFPFLIFVPAFVNFSPVGLSSIQTSLIAFAGPLVNLILWLVPMIILKKVKLSRKWAYFLFLTKMINMWLFIFNMLPIPPFDGSQVFAGLFQVFAGLWHLIF